MSLLVNLFYFTNTQDCCGDTYLKSWVTKKFQDFFQYHRGVIFSSPGTNVLGEVLSYPRRRCRCRRRRWRRQFQVKVFVF